MTKFNTLTASILFAALSLTACGDNNDTVVQPNLPDTNTQEQRISGMIKDANGSPVVGGVFQGSCHHQAKLSGL